MHVLNHMKVMINKDLRIIASYLLEMKEAVTGLVCNV